jgi:hypothetical protein
MTNQQTHWMSIREAALALSVSELTIRRRIKDGRMSHRLVNGKYYVDLQPVPENLRPHDGPRANNRELSSQPHVEVPRLAARSTRPPGASEWPGDDAVSALSINADAADENSSQLSPHSGAPGFNVDALLEEHARLAEMAGRARLLEDQLAQLSARHEELREGMLSLAGRNGWLESKLEERESELKLLTDEQPRTSWWKRLFGS